MTACSARVLVYDYDPAEDSGNVLAGGDFSAGIAGWTATEAALTHVPAPGGADANGAMRVTKNATHGDMAASSPVGLGAAPVLPSSDYTATAVLTAGEGIVRNARLSVVWYDAAGVVAGYSHGTVTPEVFRSWAEISAAGRSPANARYAGVTLTFLAIPGGSVHTVDMVRITRTPRPYDDISCLADAVTVRYGRESRTEQPEPSTCTVDLSAAANPEDVAPPSLTIGAWLRVYASNPLGGTEILRFTGRVSDVSWQWEDRGEATPYAAGGQVQAASRLADLGRPAQAERGADSRPEYTHVNNILNAGGWPRPFEYRPGTEPPPEGYVIDTPDQSTGWTPLALLTEMAESTGAVVWERPALDSLVYASFWYVRDGVTGADYAATLDDCDLAADVSWSLIYELVNRLAYTYEPGGAGVVENALSVARYGPWSDALELWIHNPAAVDVPAFLVAFEGYPNWETAALVVATADLDASLYSALLHAETLTNIRVENLPSWLGTPVTDVMRLEGWEETFSSTEAGPVHEWRLSVTAGLIDYDKPPTTPPAEMWQTVESDQRWTTTDPVDLTWWAAWPIGSV